MIRKPLSRLSRFVIGMASFGVLLAIYTGISHRQYQINPRQKSVPRWSAFADGFREMTTPDESKEGQTWIGRDSMATLGRFLAGMAVGSAVAFIVGIAMGCSNYVESFLLPPIAFLASIPPTAMMVVYTLFLGLEFRLFAGVIALGIFPTLSQSIFQAVRNDVSEHAIYKAYTLGASRFEVIWEVIIPQILPRIIDAIRLQIGPAMIFLIAAEYYYADEGFGFVMKLFPRMSAYNVIFIYLIFLGIFGMLIDWLMVQLRKFLCPWYGD